MDSLSGKVLRIDPATGDGVPSNPYYDAAIHVGSLTGVGIRTAQSLPDVAPAQYGESFSSRRKSRGPIHRACWLEHLGIIRRRDRTQAEFWLADLRGIEHRPAMVIMAMSPIRMLLTRSIPLRVAASILPSPICFKEDTLASGRTAAFH